MFLSTSQLVHTTFTYMSNEIDDEFHLSYTFSTQIDKMLNFHKKSYKKHAGNLVMFIGISGETLRLWDCNLPRISFMLGGLVGFCSPTLPVVSSKSTFTRYAATCCLFCHNLNHRSELRFKPRPRPNRMPHLGQILADSRA